MKKSNYCIGVDFGTDSVRAIVVDAHNGEELASSIYAYPRWRDGLYCNPSYNQFRQNPLDYIEGIEHTVKSCVQQIGDTAASYIRAISIATTGSTPVAVDEKGVPLSLYDSFKDDPDAMFILWKDHTAIKEADEINRHASNFSTNYLRYVGGIYSSEWFWAKLLHVLRSNSRIKKACYSWVEHSDWIPFLLTGGVHASQIKRNVCAAGHKGLYAVEFGGFPPNAFFSSLDLLLDGFVDRFHGKAEAADQSAGTLCPEWAQRFGLSEEVIIGMGAVDAHMGAVGGQIEPYHLSKVIGTSTCDMLVVPREDMKDKLVKGISGQVDGSIIPGMVGLEAGQSAFGDIYAWFCQLLSWPLQRLKDSKHISSETVSLLLTEVSDSILGELGREASLLPFAKSNELAIDWFNGRRTPDANPLLKGSIHNLSLGSDAPKIYRALVESTCFGARRIMERFKEEEINIKGIIAVGGIPRKSNFVMQMLSDVLNKPIRVAKSEQTCALGAAMFAATVAGIYPSVEEAMLVMGQGFDRIYEPRKELNPVIEERYYDYIESSGMLEMLTMDKGFGREKHGEVR